MWYKNVKIVLFWGFFCFCLGSNAPASVLKRLFWYQLTARWRPHGRVCGNVHIHAGSLRGTICFRNETKDENCCTMTGGSLQKKKCIERNVLGEEHMMCWKEWKNICFSPFTYIYTHLSLSLSFGGGQIHSTALGPNTTGSLWSVSIHTFRSTIS